MTFITHRLLTGHDLVTFPCSFLSEMNRGSVCEIITLCDNQDGHLIIVVVIGMYIIKGSISIPCFFFRIWNKPLKV